MSSVHKTDQHRFFHLALLTGVFLLSRTIFYVCGIRFDYSALADYWQYLDIDSLRHNLLRGIWYQSGQPPLFNIFLGGLLKISPRYPSVIFPAVFMIISLTNGLLLSNLISKVTGNIKLALAFAIVYLVSPATVLLENELFYTGFVSMLLLGSVHYLAIWWQSHRTIDAFLFFLGLALVCLSKSFYHLLWIGVNNCNVDDQFFPAFSMRKTLLAAVLPLMLVTGWYAKNYVVFGSFSASSWSGMSLARLVYNGNSARDSHSIASIPPFSPVSSYSKFVEEPTHRLDGLNDKVLKSEFKNGGGHINMFNENYRAISAVYFKTSLRQIRNHPSGYLKNVSRAWIIFFTPASSYFKIEKNERKIKLYDALTSLNFTAFFEDSLTQKLSLALASLPMMLLYMLVFIFFLRNGSRVPLNVFILITIVYSLCLSSFFEYGENMRFRYEIQPLFFILLAQAAHAFIGRSRSLIPFYRT